MYQMSLISNPKTVSGINNAPVRVYWITPVSLLLNRTRDLDKTTTLPDTLGRCDTIPQR